MTDARTARDEAPESPAKLDRPSWFAVLRRSWKGYKRDNLSDWAAALTYRSVMCIAPGLVVLVAVLGLLGSSTTDKLLSNVEALAPGGVRDTLQTIINSVQDNRSAGIAGIVGVLVALWSASGYIAAFMRASNAIYEMGEGRPVWKTIPIRLAVAAIMVVLIVICAAIVVFTGPVAKKLGSALGLGNAAVLAWDIAKWPVLLVLVSLMLALLYYACPNVKQPGVPWISPGGVLAVIIWLIASACFAVYVANFGSYNKTFGSLASVIVFLVWIWITNLSILLGAEFNAELQRARSIAADGPAGDDFAQPRDTRKLNDDTRSAATGLSQQSGRPTRSHAGQGAREHGEHGESEHGREPGERGREPRR